MRASPASRVMCARSPRDRRPPPPMRRRSTRWQAASPSSKPPRPRTCGGAGGRDEEVFAAARDARARVDANATAVADLAQKLPAATAAERAAVEEKGKRVPELDTLGSRVDAVERSQQAAARDDRALRLALAAIALN